MGVDRYGLIEFPPEAGRQPRPSGDPALEVIVAFAQAVLNQYQGPAWTQVCPGKRVVENTYTHDP